MVKKLLVGLLIAPLLLVALLFASGHGYIWSAFSKTYLVGNPTANINDHAEFNTREIANAAPQPWLLHPQFEPGVIPAPLEEYLTANGGVAFLVIHRGQILAEYYRKQYGPHSKTNSFSMAKTVVSLLLGKALEDGHIESLDQPITDFLPEFESDPHGRLATVGSLSTMSSGYEWDENYYSAFSPTVKLLYGDDVESYVLEGVFTEEPGSVFYYSSASTQLLGITLLRALRRTDPKATLSGYLSQTLWQPLGMNDSALWHLDEQGMELAYCCLSTNARNYARLGQLMLQNGRWADTQLIDSGFIELMQKPGLEEYYGYGTWLSLESDPAFFSFRGHLGQYIVVVPEHELVVVRLGEWRNRERDTMTETLPFYIEQALSMVPDQTLQPSIQ